MTLDELANEVRILSAANRRLKRWILGAVLLGLAMCGIVVMQEGDVPDVILARRFELVGAGGEVLAALKTEQEGIPVLEMRVKSPMGRTERRGGGLRLGLSEYGGPGLMLFDRSDKLRASLGVFQELEPGSAGGRDIAVIKESQEVRILLYDRDGSVLVSLPE